MCIILSSYVDNINKYNEHFSVNGMREPTGEEAGVALGTAETRDALRCAPHTQGRGWPTVLLYCPYRFPCMYNNVRHNKWKRMEYHPYWMTKRTL